MYFLRLIFHSVYGDDGRMMYAILFCSFVSLRVVRRVKLHASKNGLKRAPHNLSEN